MDRDRLTRPTGGPSQRRSLLDADGQPVFFRCQLAKVALDLDAVPEFEISAIIFQHLFDRVRLFSYTLFAPSDQEIALFQVASKDRRLFPKKLGSMLRRALLIYGRPRNPFTVRSARKAFSPTAWVRAGLQALRRLPTGYRLEARIIAGLYVQGRQKNERRQAGSLAA